MPAWIKGHWLLWLGRKKSFALFLTVLPIEEFYQGNRQPPRTSVLKTYHRRFCLKPDCACDLSRVSPLPCRAWVGGRRYMGTRGAMHRFTNPHEQPSLGIGVGFKTLVWRRSSRGLFHFWQWPSCASKPFISRAPAPLEPHDGTAITNFLTSPQVWVLRALGSLLYPCLWENEAPLEENKLQRN